MHIPEITEIEDEISGTCRCVLLYYAQELGAIQLDGQWGTIPEFRSLAFNYAKTFGGAPMFWLLIEDRRIPGDQLCLIPLKSTTMYGVLRKLGLKETNISFERNKIAKEWQELQNMLVGLHMKIRRWKELPDPKHNPQLPPGRHNMTIQVSTYNPEGR